MKVTFFLEMHFQFPMYIVKNEAQLYHVLDAL